MLIYSTFSSPTLVTFCTMEAPEPGTAGYRGTWDLNFFDTPEATNSPDVPGNNSACSSGHLGHTGLQEKEHMPPPIGWAFQRRILVGLASHLVRVSPEHTGYWQVCLELAALGSGLLDALILSLTH
jgi:hypothetical protein